MTIGIYLLRFTGFDGVYIGQSINIEHRYKSHIASLKSNTCNSKMYEAYKLYGVPILEILCECGIDNLDITEDTYIKEYNSVLEGLNIYRYANEAPCKQGEASGNHKYTDEDILKVFNYLVDCPTMPFINIVENTNVSIDTIRKISSLVHHTWLKDKYPERYHILETLKGNRGTKLKCAKELGICYPKIKSPTGEVFIVEHLTNFAKQHGLCKSSLCLLLNRKQKTHKGWLLA